VAGYPFGRKFLGISHRVQGNRTSHHRIAVLNQRLQARELFKITAQPLSNFNEQRALINSGLLREVDEILDRLRKH